MAPESAPTDAQRDTLRARLVLERRDLELGVARLEAEIRDVVEATRDANSDDEHDPEGATIAFERQRVGALLEAARERGRELDAAIRRLSGDGEWGRCERCGGAIGADRLAARPSARHCVTCAAAGR
jgi:RNA polymerase-binding transcription factor DksA